MGFSDLADIPIILENWVFGGIKKFCIKVLIDTKCILFSARCVYLYSVAATYPVHIQWINPSIAGPIGLVFIFQVSTPLTEHLSSLKYPAYQQYKRTTSRIIPLLPGRPLEEFEVKIR